MASLEKGIWHKSHAVWHLQPSACVYVTYDTWRMKSKCEESKRKFPLCGIKPRKRLWEKKNNSVEERKGKEGENEKNEKKRKEMRKRKEMIKIKEWRKIGKGKEERKENEKNKREEENPCVEEKKKGKGL